MRVNAVEAHVIVLIPSKIPERSIITQHKSILRSSNTKAKLKLDQANDINFFSSLSLCRTRKIVCEYNVPAKLVTSCAIYGCDLYIFTGNALLDGVIVNTSQQYSNNPNDGKIYIYRNAVPAGGYYDLPIQ